MKILEKKAQITEAAINSIVKAYSYQASRENGLSVDKLPYSENIAEITRKVNIENRLCQVTEKEVYFLLINLRKTRKLPKLFREDEKVAA